ncbi:SDR family oxidoreductase [Aggregicoccus sp. 17bor-14]|uniref:SDR family NAD(P)-dependent oxidoreductase n=1 Tax=Myxococcaceae TaxID=31 RepID=UPI00129C1D9F|nr:MULTISPECIES: SDR family oxidoreductase [Myxococcaceae]MBF5043449.1 SDR family oxidoreductase [Simulacricoccus sp. 17bor-14]MRI89207.1 SDR family oxidoreductase [Aggregicoccus sp. 17bor-14]
MTTLPSPASPPAPARPLALLTGASSGIGLDFAHLLAADGHDLVLVARTQGALQALAEQLAREHGARCQVVAADLSEEAGVQRVLAALSGAGRPVEVLVNNAGYASYGPFAEADAQGELRMIQLNVLALTALTRALLPGMLERRRGRILNVASTAAFQPGPLMAVYYATKAYVLSFSEALANETRGTGVSVTCLCPGPTKTGFQARAQMQESRLVKGRTIMDSRTVARAGYAGLLAGRPVVIPGLKNKVLAQSVRLLPRRAVTTLVRSAQERSHV